MIEDLINTIICGDCLEVMRDWPDDCVDLVLTDPPYGKKWTRGTKAIGVAKHTNESDSLVWDKKPEEAYFNKILRVGKRAIIWGGNYFTDKLPVSNCWLVWDKRGNFPRGEQVPFADCELAWTSENKVVKKFTLISQGFVSEVKELRQHPTQKPLELFAWCVKMFSKEGDVVADMYLGSGTTCVAAKMLGRRYIGIDISPEYCEIARKRIEAADKGITVKELDRGQGVLFR